MDESNATRKLAQIFCAGVAGYSRLTSSDDLGIHWGVIELLDLARVCPVNTVTTHVVGGVPST